MRKKQWLRKSLCFALILILGFSGLISTASANNGVELRNLVAGKNYELSKPPADAYPDSGNDLTDGLYGKREFSDKAWQGHYVVDGNTRSITFDLGGPKSIQKISANFLHQFAVGSYFPKEVSIEVSHDKQEWVELSKIYSKKYTGEQRPMTQKYTWDGREEGVPGYDDINIEMVYTQYIRINFTFTQGGAWVFLDEIEIWGTDGKAANAGALPIIEEDDEEEDESDYVGYLRAGEQTGDVNNLVLLYNQGNMDGTWRVKENIIPYVGYVNRDGEIEDWLFDGVLYLGLNAPSGRQFGENTNPSNKQDWDWYLNNTFKTDGDMATLNEAVKEVGEKLGEPEKKLKVFLMIPYPSMAQSAFGDIDGAGEVLNFNHKEVGEEKATENKKKAMNWYMNNALNLWEENNYSNLEFIGFYWLNEWVNPEVPDEPELIGYAKDIAHNNGLKLLWIPHYGAFGYDIWAELGFDSAVLQPGYMFNQYIDASRLEETAKLSRKYGLGVEIEVDGHVLNDTEQGEINRNKYYDYLNYGISEGYVGDVVKAYYQDGRVLLDCSRSSYEKARAIYDTTYDFIKGNGEYAPGDPVEPEDPENPEEPIEKEWVIADDIVIKGAANMQGAYIDGGIPGEYEDDAYILGTSGEQRRLEGFLLELEGAPSDMTIVYRAHVQANAVRPNENDDDLETTWEDGEGKLWKREGVFLGQKGEKRRIEGVELRLINRDTGEAYEGYKVQYQTYIHEEGWGDEWIEDGAFSGTKEKSERVEAVRIRILKEQPVK